VSRRARAGTARAQDPPTRRGPQRYCLPRHKVPLWRVPASPQRRCPQVGQKRGRALVVVVWERLSHVHLVHDRDCSVRIRRRQAFALRSPSVMGGHQCNKTRVRGDDVAGNVRLTLPRRGANRTRCGPSDARIPRGCPAGQGHNSQHDEMRLFYKFSVSRLSWAVESSGARRGPSNRIDWGRAQYVICERVAKTGNLEVLQWQWLRRQHPEHEDHFRKNGNRSDGELVEWSNRSLRWGHPHTASTGRVGSSDSQLAASLFADHIASNGRRRPRARPRRSWSHGGGK
jgi:hypothetical protein